MAHMAFYIEAMGLAVDEKGNPANGSIKINFGEYKPDKEISYAELIKDKDPQRIIEAFLPQGILNLTEIKFITPEYYAQEYGDEDEEDLP